VSDVEAYFITRKFSKFSDDIKNEMPKLKTMTSSYLEKENEELFRHFNARNILEALPLTRWYSTIFTSILSKLALIRIFDKIASGQLNIVVFLFIVICSHLFTRYSLKVQNIDVEEVIKIIESCGGENESEKSEVYVNKTIELWQKYMK
jgi:hypothetical protein